MLVIIAAGPLIASVLGRVFLHETAYVRTWLTGAIVLAGLVKILEASLGRGNIDGDLLALAGASCLAAVTIHSVLALRAGGDRDANAAALA